MNVNPSDAHSELFCYTRGAALDRVAVQTSARPRTLPDHACMHVGQELELLYLVEQLLSTVSLV